MLLNGQSDLSQRGTRQGWAKFRCYKCFTAAVVGCRVQWRNSTAEVAINYGSSLLITLGFIVVAHLAVYLRS